MAVAAHEMGDHGPKNLDKVAGQRHSNRRMQRLAAFGLAVAGMALQGAQSHPLMDDYNHAWQLAGEAHPYEAIPLLKQIISKDKTFHLAYETLIFAYRQTKELGAAEEYFRSL